MRPLEGGTKPLEGSQEGGRGLPGDDEGQYRSMKPLHWRDWHIAMRQAAAILGLTHVQLGEMRVTEVLRALHAAGPLDPPLLAAASPERDKFGFLKPFDDGLGIFTGMCDDDDP